MRAEHPRERERQRAKKSNNTKRREQQVYIKLERAQTPITVRFFIRLTDNRQTKRHFYRLRFVIDYHWCIETNTF